MVLDEIVLSNYLKASEVAKKVKEFSEKEVCPGVGLLELAEKIEAKIIELGAEPAFPVNLSRNETAAHYTPFEGDPTPVSQNDLIKVDIGVQVNGFIVDFAFSKDFSGKNQKLVQASEAALSKAVSLIKPGVSVYEIGAEIEKTIHSFGFLPIYNLSGHRVDEYSLHAGVEIPNHPSGNYVFEEGDVFAVEPFATNGCGKVVEGDYCEIFSLIEEKKIRLPNSRKLYDFVLEKYKGLPFSKRWLSQLFSSRSTLDLALADLLRQKVIHSYPILNEEKKGLVSQAETTVIIEENGVRVLV